MSTALYVAKRSLCKVLLDYIYALNNLIRSTRNLINEKVHNLCIHTLIFNRTNDKLLVESII
jgi:hypothetical protein